MVGIDLEWKVEFIQKINPKPAILQLFSHEGGYIVDLISL